MIWLYIFVPFACLVIGVAGGYALGYFHSTLLNKIRTLAEQVSNKPEPEEPLPEPATPSVIGGEYQPPLPPAATNLVANTRQKAGLSDTKTPELLEWEEQERNRLALEGKQG